MKVNPSRYWIGSLAAKLYLHGTKVNSSGYWIGLLAAGQYRVKEIWLIHYYAHDSENNDKYEEKFSKFCFKANCFNVIWESL